MHEIHLKESSPLGMKQICQFSTVETIEKDKKKHCFRLHDQKTDESFYMCAESTESMINWIKQIKTIQVDQSVAC